MSAKQKIVYCRGLSNTNLGIFVCPMSSFIIIPLYAVQRVEFSSQSCDLFIRNGFIG